MRKLFSLVAFIALYAIAAQAQLWSGVITTARAGNGWANAGIPGGLPDSAWTQCGSTIAAYSGTAATINSALSACTANHYVLLGAGTFTLSSAIVFPSNTTGHIELRGSGSTSTQLTFTGSTTCSNGTSGTICIQSSDGTYPGEPSPTTTTWTAGYAQGATQITLGSVAGITLNQTWLVLNQCDTGFSGTACTTGAATDNGGYFVCSVVYNGTTGCSVSGPDGLTWRTNAWQQEVVQVTAINPGGCGATCVTISQPLEHPNWASGQSPEAIIIQPMPQVGVTNLAMDGNSLGTGIGEAIGFFNVYQGFVSGVRIANYYDFGIYGLDTSHMLIQNDYFYRSNGHPDAYAIRLSWSGDDLIQNNIIQQWKNSITNDGPATDEVVAYNYSVDQIVPSPSDQMWGAYWTHSTGDDFSLWEGNIGDQKQDDNVHGSHLNSTHLRNFLTGWESCKNATTGGSNCGAQTNKDETSVGLVESSNVRYANEVGNVLGTPGATVTYILSTPFAGYGVYNLGAGGTNSPATPYDPLVQCKASDTNMCWANWDNVTNTVRFCGNSSDTGWGTTCASTSEVPTSAPTYAQTVPTLGDTGAGQGALPTSFYLSSKPSWFGSTTWPPIGPDVTSGNISQCTGTFNTTNQAGLPATSTALCGSGALTNAWAGHVNANPAMANYFAAGGLPDGTGPELSPNLNYGVSLPTVTVSYGSPEQTMDGFGGGQTYVSAYSLPNATTDAFFSSGGMGFSWIRTGNFQDGLIDDQVTLTRAVADGAQIIMSLQSPPVSIKASPATWNNGTLGPDGHTCFSSVPSLASNMKTWANGIVSILAQYNSAGLPITALSVETEPNINEDAFGSCLMDATGFDEFIKVLGPILAASAYHPRLLMPETSGWISPDYATTCLNDATCAQYVDTVNSHNYGVGGVDGTNNGYCCATATAYPLAATKGKRIWMTETNGGLNLGSTCGNGLTWCYDPSIADALVWAHQIHDYLTVSNVSYWQYWAMLYTGNLGYWSETSQIPKRFYAVGNWAKFVQPGYQRVDCTASPVTNVDVTCFKGTSGQVVVVAVNQNTSTSSISFALSGITISSVTPWLTSATSNLISQTPVSVSGNTWSYSLPAQSVTSFVGAATGTVSVSPSSLTFGNQSIGTQSSAQTITLTNTGSTAVAISLPITVSPTSDYVFTTSSNPCPATLAVSSSCLINVAFGPSAVGTRTATVSITDSAVGSPQTISLTGTGISSGATSPATLVSTNAAFSFTNSGTISAGTVNTGDIINYFVTTTSASATFTMTDNCNTGAGSDTNVVDKGPTNQGLIAATSQSGHFVVGLGRTGCTVTDVASGSGDVIISIQVIRGSTGLDVSGTINNQNGAGTGGNSVVSSTVTTTQTDLCLASTVNTNLGGGTLSAGTTLAWILGTVSATFPNGSESFTQSAAGSITATFGYTVSPYTQTGISCYSGTTAPPTITSLSAISGNIGATFTITGTGFGSTQSTSTVQIGGINLTVNTWSATSIAVTVPTTALTGAVVVTVSSTASNGIVYTVTPFLSGVATSPNPVGTTVTISGTGFTATQGSSVVAFNGTSCTPSAWSSTSITCVVPANATTGNVTATVGGNTSNGIAFVVSPAITSLSVSSGTVGASVVISGTTFGASQGASTVTFNGVTATCGIWSPPSLACTVPVGATTGNVIVTVAGQASNGVAFTVVSLPIVSSVSPNAGVISSTTTIAGSHFGATQGSSTVTFNGTAALCGTWSNTSLACTVPSGATTGNVVVTTSVGASNGVLFTVTMPSLPAITSLTPNAGPIGTSVTIAGSNFGAPQGSSTVAFSGTAATCGTWSATSLVCTAPSGAATGPVVVTTTSGASNGVTFTVTMPSLPTITSLTPNAGLVGTTVIIAGSSFGATQGTSTVTFNGTAAICSSWSATSLSCTVPTGATTGNVVATTTTGASNGVVFTVTPSSSAPIISGVTPTAGLGGVLITITGSNFGATQGASSVSFGGIFCTPSLWSATKITCPAPSGMPLGPSSLTVTVGGNASNSVNFQVLQTQIIIFSGAVSNVNIQ